jgi:hypothetical protein
MPEVYAQLWVVAEVNPQGKFRDFAKVAGPMTTAIWEKLSHEERTQMTRGCTYYMSAEEAFSLLNSMGKDRKSFRVFEVSIRSVTQLASAAEEGKSLHSTE